MRQRTGEPVAALALVVLVAAILAGWGSTALASGRILLPEARVEEYTWDFDPVLDPDVVVVPGDAVRIVVHTPEELDAALAAAAPGQLIELADGTYDSGAPFVVKGVRGTAARPLIIRAQNQGGAEIAGDSWFLVEDSSYVVIAGLKFTTTDKTNSFAVRLRNTSHSRVTRNHFALQESPLTMSSRHWVYIGGTGADYNRIDHNFFEKKRRLGNFVSINGDDVQVAQHTRVDRNHFKDVRSVNANGMETIRIGSSSVARSHAFAVIEYNLFEQCSGEAEIITVKSGGNVIRYNTFWESEGAVTFRHGNDNRAYGNYFLGNNKPNTGGIRVYGRGHLVYNNHFEGLEGTGIRSALTIGMADIGYQETVLNYWRVERLLVAHNTFVNNRSSIAVGTGSEGTFAPRSTLIANNLIVSNKPGPLITLGKAEGVTWLGNMAFATGSATVGLRAAPEEVAVVDPGLVLGSDGVHYVPEGSPAIDAGQGLPALALIAADVEGKPRDARPDVGAFEQAGFPLLRGPLTPAEVGPNAPPAERFSLEVPAVHITRLDLVGERHRSAWWGPLTLDAAVVTTGGAAGPVQLTVIVDGEPVFRGSTRALDRMFSLNHGELSDGEHRLTLVAEVPDGGGARDEVSLTFDAANVRIDAPPLAAVGRGDLPVEIAVGFPADEIDAVQVFFGDELVHAGREPQVRFTLDTLRYEERAYRLRAVALGKGGARAESFIDVSIDNEWEIEDALLPPQDWGFLGTIDRSKTSAKSDGWRHVTDRPEAFGGDADRLAPAGGGEEFLVWEAPLLHEALVTLYAWGAGSNGSADAGSGGDAAERVKARAILSVSADGASWLEVPYEARVAGGAAEGWLKVQLLPELPDPAGIRYFRLTLAGAGSSGEAAGPEAAGSAQDPGPAIQVGHVSLRGWNPAGN